MSRDINKHLLFETDYWRYLYCVQSIKKIMKSIPVIATILYKESQILVICFRLEDKVMSPMSLIIALFDNFLQLSYNLFSVIKLFILGWLSLLKVNLCKER